MLTANFIMSVERRMDDDQRQVTRLAWYRASAKQPIPTRSKCQVSDCRRLNLQHLTLATSQLIDAPAVYYTYYAITCPETLSETATAGLLRQTFRAPQYFRSGDKRCNRGSQRCFPPKHSTSALPSARPCSPASGTYFYREHSNL